MFSEAIEVSHQARAVFTDVQAEMLQLAEIARRKTVRQSKIALLREKCERHLAGLQSAKQIESESLSDSVVQLSGVSLSEVHRRCELAQTRLTELSGEVQRQNEQITDLLKKRTELLSVKENIVNDSDVSRGSIIDFYRLTTRIRWEFDTECNKIIGFVAEPDNVETFEFDSNENSMFFITNKIWSMMTPMGQKNKHKLIVQP